MTPHIVLLAAMALTKTAPTHKFLDRPAKIELTAAISLAAADAAQTCYDLRRGAHELGLPTQHCQQVNLILFGQVAAQEFVAYEFHKHNHHRLERITRFVTIERNAQGIIWSTLH